MPGTIETYSGRCHCGALGYRYETALAPETWSIRACQCRFCRIHSALSTSDPDGALEFVADDPACLTRYRFALRITDFFVCNHCGVYLGATTTTSERGLIGVVNVRPLDAIAKRLRDPIAASYDGETADERSARRNKRWTSVAATPRP
jgi:hypothetical protein